MKFNAIIGNPPYQVMDGGAKASATPIYNEFVDMVEKMKPAYMSMIMPARWYAGGKGLDKFRERMIADTRIRFLIDFSNSADCFPSLGNREIKGGLCYFLWDENYHGKCHIISMKQAKCKAVSFRYLKEPDCEIFIRDYLGVSILNKIRKRNEKSFASIVSTRKPFQFATNFTDFDDVKKSDGQAVIYAFRKTGYIDRSKIKKNIKWVDMYKLFIPEAIGNADVATDVIKPIMGKPNTCCTETYLVVGPFDKEKKAKNCISYIKTKFFHYLLSLKKITQHTTQKCYEFIPCQDFGESWSDEKLYHKYNFSEEEIHYINSLVWPLKED